MPPESESMRRARTLLALIALALLGGIVVSYQPSGLPIGREASTLAVKTLLVPLALAAVGLLRRTGWGRVIGLSVALAVLPWAIVLTLTPSLGVPVTRQAVALAGSALLLFALARRDEVEAIGAAPRSRHQAWIRWCLVLNFAAILHLYVFVIAYRFGASWQLMILGSLLAALLLGVGFLARQKTIGLLMLAASALLLIPGAALFVSAEARSPEEAVLFFPAVRSGYHRCLGLSRGARQAPDRYAAPVRHRNGLFAVTMTDG